MKDATTYICTLVLDRDAEAGGSWRPALHFRKWSRKPRLSKRQGHSARCQGYLTSLYKEGLAIPRAGTVRVQILVV